jgi:hypothetical protein
MTDKETQLGQLPDRAVEAEGVVLHRTSLYPLAGLALRLVPVSEEMANFLYFCLVSRFGESIDK